MLKETIIIVGDSPFLATIEDKIHYLLERYDSIGINNAIRKYSIRNHAFLDDKFISLTNQYPDIKTITLYKYGDMIKGNKELYDSYPFNFKKNTKEDIIKDRKLAWCGFTHDFVLSYCIIKGYKRIILAGTADFTGYKHYITNEDFNYTEKLKSYSKKFIEEICSNRAKIYTLNKDSILEIPKLDISFLLKK